MPRKPRRGTKPVSQMAAPQSRTRQACVQTAHISPIFVIPTAPSSSRLLGRLPDLELRRTALFRAVLAILDSAMMCHIGYVIDGQPYVTPTLFWREGERLYWHGSSASRMLRNQTKGTPVCLTVTHVDGR